MPLVRTADLVASATADGHAVVAFNVITLEHAEAIAAAAEQVRRPAILQISQNAVRFHGGRVQPIAAAAAAVAQQSSATLALHLDHVEDMELLRQASDAGFSSAMFDAGALSYAANVRATREAVEWAHESGLWLEAELGYVGGKPDAPVSAHAAGARTDPAEALAYVTATGLDALAVAVGNTHAMSDRTAVLDHDLIAALHHAVPVPLVLHGSSGVADSELRAAVHSGIAKINVGTALNVAFTHRLRAALESGSSSDPRIYLAPARAAMTTVGSDLLAVISTSGLRPGPS
ncbi:MAG: class II fructose-bisphosphate aldolase [Nakamurella sp.]